MGCSKEPIARSGDVAAATQAAAFLRRHRALVLDWSRLG